jgi:hypothetical protein
MIKVVGIKPENNYHILIKFNNGQSGVVNFKSIFENDTREIGRSLLDKKMFQTMKINLNTICGDNDVDFAPDFLLKNCLSMGTLIKQRRR